MPPRDLIPFGLWDLELGSSVRAQPGSRAVQAASHRSSQWPPVARRLHTSRLRWRSTPACLPARGRVAGVEAAPTVGGSEHPTAVSGFSPAASLRALRLGRPVPSPAASRRRLLPSSCVIFLLLALVASEAEPISPPRHGAGVKLRPRVERRRPEAAATKHFSRAPFFVLLPPCQCRSFP